MTIIPNDAQKRALAHMATSMGNRMVTVMPPGTGKTFLAALHAQESEAKSVLYIAHLREILDQANESFKQVFDHVPHESFGHLDGENRDYDAQFCFASIQTIRMQHHFDRLMEAHSNHFDYVVVDEYHHARAKTYDAVIDKLRGKFKTFLGITATPFRLDGKDPFYHVSGNVIFQMTLKEAMHKSYLVPFRYYAYFDNIDYSKIRWQKFNYNQKQLDKAYSIPQRDERIIREYKELGMQGKQTLGFCVSVAHAERMAVKFAGAGIRARVLSHKTDRSVRKEIVRDFRAGKIQAVFTRDLFNEGIDFPEVECILLLRPTVSKTVFYQQIGRGLRKNPGKSNVVIMDFIGNFRKNFEINRMLIEEMGAEERPHGERPIFEYDIPTVHFQKELIDFWKEQEKKNLYVKSRIVEKYKALRAELNRPPALRELYEYTAYNVMFYFDSYTDLLRAAGENETLIKMAEEPTQIQKEQIDAFVEYVRASGRRF